jgi:serine/threonine-protein kinase
MDMSNWKRTATAVISALAFLGLGAATAHADSFGAISLSPKTGATGWSYDYSSRLEAEEVAQSHCDRNARDCRVAIWFKNGCGAVARGADGGWGSDWAPGSRRAQRAALAACSNHSDSCRVIRWQCSGAN